jgi:hypothetical protein
MKDTIWLSRAGISRLPAGPRSLSESYANNSLHWTGALLVEQGAA